MGSAKVKHHFLGDYIYIDYFKCQLPNTMYLCTCVYPNMHTGELGLVVCLHATGIAISPSCLAVRVTV